MPEKYVNPAWLNEASALTLMITLSVLGLFGRVLAKDEPINWRKLCGEGILAAIGGLALFSAGMIQGLPLWGIILMACLSGLGGVKAVEIGGQIWNTIRAGQGGAK